MKPGASFFVFTNDVNVLFLPGFLTSLSKGGVRVMLRVHL
jgi:hypothetical protein